VGDPVRLFVEGLADPVEAKIERVSDRVDPGTRTYEVRGSVSDPSGLLKAGSYARAELSSTRSEPRPVVHRSALVTRDGRTFVLRIEDGVVRYSPVRVGIVEAERAEVLSGLAVGDLVVRGEAATRLAEGARVEIPDEGVRAATAQRE
jgi:multidrug efflux pump subunit AcrA (membrane-fusion protein)